MLPRATSLPAAHDPRPALDELAVGLLAAALTAGVDDAQTALISRDADLAALLSDCCWKKVKVRVALLSWQTVTLLLAHNHGDLIELKPLSDEDFDEAELALSVRRPSSSS